MVTTSAILQLHDPFASLNAQQVHSPYNFRQKLATSLSQRMVGKIAAIRQPSSTFLFLKWSTSTQCL